MRFGIFSVVDHYPNEMNRTESQFVSELCEQAELADELGFHSFWIAEHHFHEYGLIPRPAIMLAALAKCTKRIRLGSAVAVLPFDNPLRTAEDFAMVDILSDGRLDFGVGSGYLQHEFAGFNLTTDERRERFDEALSIIREAWTGNAVDFDGKYNKITNTKINILPLQTPEPPVHIAVLRNEVAPFVGKQQVAMMLIPYATTDSMTQLKDTCTSYTNAYNEASKGEESNYAIEAVKARQQISFGLHTYCAESTDIARSFARPFMDRYVRTRLYAKQRSFEELVEKNLLAVGDTNEIIRVARLYEECGLTDFLMIMNFGGLPHAAVLQSIQLVAEKVLPEFAGHSTEQKSEAPA